MKNKLKKFYDYFEVNENNKTILKESTPENIKDYFRDEIHKTDMMPNDTRYDMILETVEKILEYDFNSTDEILELEPEICDSMVSIYNSSLVHWLSTHHIRQDYCNEYLELLNGENIDLIKILKGGQYLEYLEIFNSIINLIESDILE